MPLEALGCVAGGSIHPYVFVTLSATPSTLITNATGFVVVESVGGDRIVGVSQRGNRYAPWPALDDGLAAKLNENVGVFVDGSRCEILLAGTVAANDLLKPTTAGQAVTAASDGDWYGAQAEQAGVAGQIIWVRVMIGQRGGTN